MCEMITKGEDLTRVQWDLAPGYGLGPALLHVFFDSLNKQPPEVCFSHGERQEPIV